MTTRQSWLALVVTLIVAAASYAVGLTVIDDYPASRQGPGLPPATGSADSPDAYAHLEQLAKIATAHEGNRASGTEGYDAAAEYVEAQLQAAGLETTRQEFSFTFRQTLTDSLTETEPTERDIPHEPVGASPSTPDGGVSADVRTPQDPTGCASDEYGDVDDAIVLVQRGECSFADKSLAAGAAGAAALVVYNNEAGELGATLGKTESGMIPTVGISEEEGLAAIAAIDAGTVRWTVEYERVVEERETFNVIAETPSGRADNVVLLGAHLDSVPEGPGINDNGSGVAALLEVAADLGAAGPLTNKVRLAFWGAEETGLDGSTHYVDQLADDDFDALAVYLNFDMVASPNPVIAVYDGDSSTYSSDTIVPDGSAPAASVFTSYFDSIGQPWVDTALDGRSDYQSFQQNGVPVSGLFTGADGSKTAQEADIFGGTADAAYDASYHTADDDLDNVDVDALRICVAAISHAATALAADTSAINGR